MNSLRLFLANWTVKRGKMSLSANTSGRKSKRGRRERSRPMSDINVTPFVDVMLVLLVGFYGYSALVNYWGAGGSSQSVNFSHARTR